MANDHETDRPERQVVGFLGVGLDNGDGEARFTRSDHFLLLGGSGQTHERMQALAIQCDAELKRRGKPLEAYSVEEMIELLKAAKR